MSAFFVSLVLFLPVVAQLGTHVLYATLGGILCEKVGNLNLGLEGLMLMGGACGVYAALNTGNPYLAVFVSCIAGAVGALIYAVLTVTFRANQVVTGLALTIFGTGFSSMIGVYISGKPMPASVASVLGSKTIPGLSKIPVLGKMLFSQSLFVPVAVVLAIIVYIYLNKTRIGLNTKMIGENPSAADASGINVTLYKYLNIIVGGVLCGLGGGYFAMVYGGIWRNQIIAGAGWIAVAMVIFSIWNPLRAIFGAYLFGALRGIGFKLQSGIFIFDKKIVIPSTLLDMLPYIITILVLVIITIKKHREYQAPSSLSLPYFREDR